MKIQFRGNSMTPSLIDGETIFIEEKSVGQIPQRGEIWAYWYLGQIVAHRFQEEIDQFFFVSDRTNQKDKISMQQLIGPVHAVENKKGRVHLVKRHFPCQMVVSIHVFRIIYFYLCRILDVFHSLFSNKGSSKII